MQPAPNKTTKPGRRLHQYGWPPLNSRRRGGHQIIEFANICSRRRTKFRSRGAFCYKKGQPPHYTQNMRWLQYIWFYFQHAACAMQNDEAEAQAAITRGSHLLLHGERGGWIQWYRANIFSRRPTKRRCKGAGCYQSVRPSLYQLLKRWPRLWRIIYNYYQPAPFKFANPRRRLRSETIKRRKYEGKKYILE